MINQKIVDVVDRVTLNREIMKIKILKIIYFTLK